MSKLLLNFFFDYARVDEEWPGNGNDYGHIMYTYGENKTYKDGGGYLHSFIWNLVNSLEKIKSGQEDYITSLDGDFGLKVSPTEHKVNVTVYAGTNDVYSMNMSLDEYSEFCVATMDNYYETALKMNPNLKNLESFNAPRKLLSM